MDIVLVNLSTVPVPFSSHKAGIVEVLAPDTPYPFASADMVVATVGDNPSFKEDLAQAASDILELVLRFIAFWRANTPKEAEDKAVVQVRIHNNGTNPLRVILGDPTNDTVVEPGAFSDVEAPDYVELRELGV